MPEKINLLLVNEHEGNNRALIDSLYLSDMFNVVSVGRYDDAVRELGSDASYDVVVSDLWLTTLSAETTEEPVLDSHKAGYALQDYCDQLASRPKFVFWVSSAQNESLTDKNVRQRADLVLVKPISNSAFEKEILGLFPDPA